MNKGMIKPLENLMVRRDGMNLGVLAQRIEDLKGRESLIRVLKYIKSSGKEGTGRKIIVSSIILCCYSSYQANWL